MRKGTKQRLASYLLDEFGMIDDRFVAEAQTWRAERPAVRKNSIRVLLVAAALTLVLAVGIAGTVTVMLRRDENRFPAEGEQSTEIQPTVGTPVARLDALLSAAAGSPSFSSCSADELRFFDGNVRLAVKDRSSGELYVSRALTASEQATLSASLNANGSPVEPNSDGTEYLVWVTLGDGRVLSPCLALSNGNVSTATLFDYEVEYIPSQSFQELVESLT